MTGADLRSLQSQFVWHHYCPDHARRRMPGRGCIVLALAAICAAASLAASCLTCLGGAMAAFCKPLTERRHNLLMAFAAVVVIAAAFFSLIIPGKERAQSAGS